MDGGHRTPRGLGSTAGDVEHPAQFVSRALNSRADRIAQSEVRRAARRALSNDIRIAKPEEGTAAARDAIDVADARAFSWVRTDDLARLLERGDAAATAEVIDDLLRTEEAIQVVVDSLPVAPNWRNLVDELSGASDLIIESLQAQRAALPGRSYLSGVRTGQSVWIRAWRPFVLVATHGE